MLIEAVQHRDQPVNAESLEVRIFDPGNIRLRQSGDFGGLPLRQSPLPQLPEDLRRQFRPHLPDLGIRPTQIAIDQPRSR